MLQCGFVVGKGASHISRVLLARQIAQVRERPLKEYGLIEYAMTAPTKPISHALLSAATGGADIGIWQNDEAAAAHGFLFEGGPTLP